MRKLPQHLFFDLGNVIIPIDFSRNWNYFEKLGADKKHLEQHWSIQYSFHPMFQDYENGRLSTDELRIEFQKIFLQGKEITLREFEDGLAALLLPIPSRRIHFIDMLRSVGYRCHVISNNTELHTRYIRETFVKEFGRRLEDTFEHVFLSQEVGCRKPDKAIYQIALERTGGRADDALMIDDMPLNLAGAEQLGLHTLLVSPEDEVEDKIRQHFIF